MAAGLRQLWTVEAIATLNHRGERLRERCNAMFRLRGPELQFSGLGSSLKLRFEIDFEHCPNCGGELKIIAAILDAPVIEKILTHLGLQARAPPRVPAPGPQLQAA